MDRSVLESDPHRVLEGMIDCRLRGGSKSGLHLRARGVSAGDQEAEVAIREARRLGFLGSQICNTKFSFDIDIRIGGGAFVCGEETALIASIEGKRGTPRPRPPFPASMGLGKCRLSSTMWKPSPIFRRSSVEAVNGIAPWARKKQRALKYSLSAGKVRNTGLIEVPMGITLREIIFEIGGGVPDGRRFKAVQTGGPSGGCIPESPSTSGRLRVPEKSRLDHGLGRNDCYGRHFLHGECGAVLHGVLHVANPAESAFRAAPALHRCSDFWKRITTGNGDAQRS